jgi:hypothetical protein
MGVPSLSHEDVYLNFQLAATPVLGFLVAIAGLLAGPRTTVVPPFAVTGVVFDSITNRALAGASVQMVGADSIVASERFTASSDSLGRFRFAAVPAGRYILGFYHRALDTLGIEPRGQLIDIRSNLDVTLASPSPRTMVRAFCGDTISDDHATLLLGHLHDAETESAILNGAAVVTWSEARVANREIAVAERVATATSREDGWFALCGLPRETALTVRAVRDTNAGRADSSSGVVVRFARAQVQHLSIYVPRTATSAAQAGTLRLSGRVTDAIGRAISGAQVWIAGTERRTVTNSTGNYALDSLPSGTQSLEVRAIGYSPRTMVVTLVVGAPPTGDVTMEQAVVLPTVVTMGAKSSKNLATFEAHKRSSAGGYFIKPARLEGYASLQPLHFLVGGLPGVTVLRPFGQWIATMQRRGASAGARPIQCTPQLYLNGSMVAMSFDDLETAIDPDDLLGVEVYTKDVQIPSIYARSIRSCGLISIWTRAPDEDTLKKPPQRH